MAGAYDAYLFDFDGVLADTEPLHWAAWNDALSTIGVSISWEEYFRHCVGISDMEFAARVGRLSAPPRSADEVFALYPIKKRRFSERSRQAHIVDQEVLATLKSLRPAAMAVVTSSSRSEIEPILRSSGLLEIIGTTVFGDEVSRLKPDPEPYLLAKERLGARRALAFEDSEAGLVSAKSAGCDVVEVKAPAALVDLIRNSFR